MEIEIVEFYPSEKQQPSMIIGTFHIKLIDPPAKTLNILGFRIMIKNLQLKTTFVSLPKQRNWNVEKKMNVLHVTNFWDDREYQREIIQKMRLKGYAYIMNKLQEESEKSGLKQPARVDSKPR